MVVLIAVLSFLDATAYSVLSSRRHATTASVASRTRAITTQPFVMPKLKDVKQQTSFDVSENLEWLIDSDEKDIERNIHRELGIGTYTGDKGLA